MKEKIIKRINPKRRYRVREIVAEKFILNKEGKPDRRLVYYQISTRRLAARMSPFGRLEVRGSDLIEFVDEYYLY